MKSRRVKKPPLHGEARLRSAFLHRVMAASDITRSNMRVKLGVPYEDVREMVLGTRGQVAEIDRDEVWTRLADYVDLRIGKLLAVREELQRKLSADRRARLARRLSIEGR